MKKVWEKGTVMMLDVSIWTGRKTLSKADRQRLGIPEDAEDVVSLGHKKIIDPKTLAPFHAIKKRAERLLYRHGVRFLGGWMVPVEKGPELLAKLGELKKEFEEAQSELSANFHRLAREWAASHEAWADLLRSDCYGVDGMSFEFYAVTVEPVPDGNLDKAVSQLGNRLFQEIASEIRQFWEKSLMGRATVTQKALRPLRAVSEKLDGLSFVDPRAIKVKAYIDAVLASMPKSGPLDEAETLKVAGLAALLAKGDGVVPDLPETPEALETAGATDESGSDQQKDQPTVRKVSNGWF